MVRCWHCHAESPHAHWLRVVENRTPLYGPWEGWRMSGRFLIAPSNAGRIMPARVLGMLWEERARSRLTVPRSPLGDRLPPRELFGGQA